MRKFIPLAKVEELPDGKHVAWGIATSEVPDKDGEICDYAAAKAAYQTWSDKFLAKTTAAGQEPSLGNVRVMHQLEIGGKVIKIEYRDDVKQIWVGSEPATDQVVKLLKGGFLTGYSQGGDYAWKKPDGQYTRYAPEIGELSYVDNPCLEEATFAFVRSDGSTEMRKFHKGDNGEAARVRANEILAEIEKLKKEANDLIALAKRAQETNMEKPSDKMVMPKPEELEKSARSVVDHLASLHKAMTDHCAEMHKAHTEHMNAMHDGLGKCMKALGVPEGVAGSISGGGEVKADKPEFTKAQLDAAIDKAVKEAKGTTTEGTLTKAQAEEMIKAALDARSDTTDPTKKVKLTLVGRDGKTIEKADKVVAEENKPLQDAVGF